MLTSNLPFRENDLLDIAGEFALARGRGYTQRVHDLAIGPGVVIAHVVGSQTYDVRVDWTHTTVSPSCTCAHNADGHFCEHLVAVSLRVMDEPAPAEAIGSWSAT